MRYHPGLGISHPGVRRIVRLYTPVALGLGVSAIGVTIDTNLASRTGEGSLAAMRFAATLVQFPLGLFAAATSFAILPSLSRYASQFWEPRATGLTLPKEPLPEVSGQESALGDQPPLLGAGAIATPVPSLALRPQEALDAYKNTLALGLKMMLLLILPAAVGLVLLRIPLIQLLFQRGEFDVRATHLTALAFLFYSPGLPAAALDQLLIFAFYARKDTVTPVLVGVMGVMVYLLVGASPVAKITMPRLALANSIQWISHALVMFLLLWRSAQGLGGLGLGETALKAIVASGAMGGVLLLFRSLLPYPDNPGGLALYLALAAGSGLAVYGAALALLRVEEVAIIWGAATKRLRRLG